MERKKLYNAYEQHEGYNCFGCASGNEHGLRCEFYEEGEYITCHWMPRPEFQGFFHVLHGGIQATLIDEIACWNVFAKVKSAGVTVELITKYRATVYSDRGELFLRSRIVEQTSRLAKMHVNYLMLTGHWEVRLMWFIEYFRKTWLVNDWDGRESRHFIPKKTSN